MRRILVLALALVSFSSGSYASGDLPFPWIFERDSVQLARWASADGEAVVLLKEKDGICGLFVKDGSDMNLGTARVACGQERIVQEITLGLDEAIVSLPVKDAAKEGLIQLYDVAIGLERSH